MSIRIPTYRFHKARNCAVTTIVGKDHYLGVHDSPESREKYHRLVAEFLAASGNPSPPTADNPLTVIELVERYWEFAKGYYVKNGNPTGEIYPLKEVLRFLRRLYGPTPAREFSPTKLKAIREAMIIHPITRTVKVVDPNTGKKRFEKKVIRVGLTRRVVNKQIGRVKRVFSWAVEEELLQPDVHAALLRVSGLKKGRSEAREKARIQAVDPALVNKVLPLLSPAVRAMVEIQRLTGSRPQEVVRMRGDEINVSSAIWEYRPTGYKCEHHNVDDEPDRARVIFIGPRAQEILRPFLLAEAGGFLFVPRRSGANREPIAEVPPQTTLRRSESGKRQAEPRLRRESYSVDTYRKAVVRACARAKIPAWSPNQLRHLRLTELRRDFGLEASRVCGGHKEIGVTQVYAARDLGLAKRVMGEVG